VYIVKLCTYQLLYSNNTFSRFGHRDTSFPEQTFYPRYRFFKTVSLIADKHKDGSKLCNILDSRFKKLWILNKILFITFLNNNKNNMFLKDIVVLLCGWCSMNSHEIAGKAIQRASCMNCTILRITRLHFVLGN